MYLSRLVLNPRSRRVQREVADPYQMHRSLMRGFPDNLNHATERVLYRLEAGQHAGHLVLLVQSLEPPDWSWLAEPNADGYLLSTDGPNPWVKPFEVQVVAGQVLAFRLRANPTIKVKREGRPKRLGLYREEDQRKWLGRKAEQGGFGVLAVRVGGEDVVGGRLYRDDATHNLRLVGVQFDGLLQVVDPNRLLESVRGGIGSGKAMGFGLLSLAQPTW